MPMPTQKVTILSRKFPACSARIIPQMQATSGQRYSPCPPESPHPFMQLQQSKVTRKLAGHLFTDGQLDGRGVLVQALQQVSSLDVLVEEGRLLAQHCLQVLLPQPGGLPGACKWKESSPSADSFCLLLTDMLKCCTVCMTGIREPAMHVGPLAGADAAAAWWPAPASSQAPDSF